METPTPSPEEVQKRVQQDLAPQDSALVNLIRGHQQPKPLANTTQQVSEAMAKSLHDERIKDRQSDRALRKTVAKTIGWALGLEIVGLFFLVLSQGSRHMLLPLYPYHYFQLDKWTFAAFVNAVLIQTFFLAQLVVKNLFPDKHSRDTSPPKDSYIDS